MKLSYNWLKEYLDCDLTPQEISQVMTSIGIEVASITGREQIPGSLGSVVVAEVLECEAHPDSDHLHITKVNDGGEEPLTVVCGAVNVAKGQKVLFAQIGAVLPGDFKIKKSKIRGVESFGMICAEDELGLGKGHEGIMVLPDSALVGTPAAEYLNLKKDVIIEYEITANRIDAASHIGVARDIYAYLKYRGKRAVLKYPPVEDLWKEKSKEKPSPSISLASISDIKVQIQDEQQAVSQYRGIEVRNVKVKDSPQWLQERLQSIGLNPINNIVDISNYVLFELGQPLHIFDADKIKDKQIMVRRALKDESLTTLDEIDRKLTQDDLVIADSEKVLCLAGIIGGKGSAVGADTKNIFIESAYFAPVSIRKSAKRHGISTDSSFHFERGVDPLGVSLAAKRAALLINEIAAGVVPEWCNESPIDICLKPVKRNQIELSYDRISSIAGQEIAKAEVDSILGALQYHFDEKNEDRLLVSAPTYMVDVERECDVVEEILRIYGYDNINLPKRMSISMNGNTQGNNKERLRNEVSDFLASNGFVETMNNSLTKESYYKNSLSFPFEHCVKIVNPLSSDLGVMRQNLIFGGLEVIAFNLNRKQTFLKFFEYGNVYCKKSEQVTPENEKVEKEPEGSVNLGNEDTNTLKAYSERQYFTLFLTGEKEKSWLEGGNSPLKADFFALKSYLDLLLRRYGIELNLMENEVLLSDVFKEALVYYIQGPQKDKFLTFGEIALPLLKDFGIKQKVFAAEIDWNVFSDLVSRNKIKFKELPKFPEVRRDMAIIIDENVNYASLYRSTLRVGKNLLKRVSLFDVYRDEKLGKGKKQYALSFVFQNEEKTLVDAEIDKIMNKILAVLQNEYGAVLR